MQCDEEGRKVNRKRKKRSEEARKLPPSAASALEVFKMAG